MNSGERLNSITHLLGAVAALAGLVVLVGISSLKCDSWKIVSFSIYGICLFLLYLFSTLYHSHNGNKKAILSKLDHIAIYLLIAGTYTPITLVSLRGVWGWSLFGVVWGITVLGVLLKIFYIHAPDWLAALIYVGMGWLAMIAIYPLVTTLQPAALMWLFLGGIFYTIGAVIYSLERPKLWPKWFGSHDLFHIFVLLGSASHFWLMYRFISEFV